VHLDLQGTEEDGLAMFVATGTAVRPLAGFGADSTQDGTPAFTSSLSGQDFHLLVRSGCAPVGFVVGTSVHHFGWRSMTRWMVSQGHCTEMVNLTSSLYAAREAAVRRLNEQATQLGADGVIDVKILERADVWGSHVIEFVAYGTAITVSPRSSPLDIDVLVMLEDHGEKAGAQGEDTFIRHSGS
jgi:uncharacterized protein YbjQ (UPF0145 family)